MYTVTLLLLTVAVAGTAVNTMHTTMSLMESNMEEHLEELEPMLAIEQLVYRMERALYLYHLSPDSGSAQQLQQLAGQIDSAFKQVMQAPFGVEAERQAVVVAKGEWHRGNTLVAALTRRDIPEAREYFAKLFGHLEQVISALSHMRLIANSELAERAHLTKQAVARARLITFSAMVVGSFIAALTGFTLLYTIFGRMVRIEEGARRLADGDMSTRVEVAGADELGRFGETFNEMASRIQQSQEELQRMATRDGLTGLYNHAEFQRLLAGEMARSQRYQHPLSLLLLDVDHFKSINDAHGHLAGDKVLRGIAGVLQLHSRPADHAARYGGEEFVLLLPEISHQGAMATAERIRHAVAELAVRVDNGHQVTTTVSIGVAAYPTHADSAEALIARADEAMYLAKQSGRNLCISAALSGD